MKILIDNGHGAETPGKRSPDGRLREYAYTRRVAAAIVAAMPEASLLVPETADIQLAERIRRVNAVCDRLGAPNVCLVSIHINAAGDGSRWLGASGCAAFTSLQPCDGSVRLATLYQRRAIELGLLGNRALPPEGFWRQNLAMCRGPRCAAVLTENMFQDNHADVDFLLSDAGFNTIVGLHIDTLKQYLL